MRKMLRKVDESNPDFKRIKNRVEYDIGGSGTINKRWLEELYKVEGTSTYVAVAGREIWEGGVTGTDWFRYILMVRGDDVKEIFGMQTYDGSGFGSPYRKGNFKVVDGEATGNPLKLYLKVKYGIWSDDDYVDETLEVEL